MRDLAGTLWDRALVGALLVTGAAVVVAMRVPNPNPGVGAFLIVVTASLGLATMALTRGVALRDRIHDDEYGELLRAVEPDGRRLLMPYFAVTFIGLVSMTVAIVAAVVVGGVKSRPLLTGIDGVVTFFFAWSLLGLITILRLDSRHSRLISRMRAVKDEAARASRAAAHDPR